MKIKGTCYGIRVLIDTENEETEAVGAVGEILLTVAIFFHNISFKILTFLGFDLQAGFPVKINKKDMEKLNGYK